MKHKQIILAAALATVLLPSVAFCQTTGSAACGTLTQTAANGAAARVAADDKDIAAPQSVKSLTCLDKFFSGIGLNVIINLLNPATLLSAIEGQICTVLTSSWQSALGSKQCGITLTGFNIGFMGGKTLGGGLSCPKLTFGGGGPPIGYIGVGANNSGKFTVTGTGMPPTGYTLPATGGLW